MSRQSNTQHTNPASAESLKLPEVARESRESLDTLKLPKTANPHTHAKHEDLTSLIGPETAGTALAQTNKYIKGLPASPSAAKTSSFGSLTPEIADKVYKGTKEVA